MSKIESTSELLKFYTQYLIEKFTEGDKRVDMKAELSSMLTNLNNRRENNHKQLKSTSDSYSMNHEKQLRNVGSPVKIYKSSPSRPKTGVTKINFMSDLMSLKVQNPDLGSLLSKCDIGNNVGSVYLDFNNKKFFNIQESAILADYTLINCFLSFIIGYIYGENKSEFHKFYKRLSRGKFKDIEMNAVAHQTFKKVVSELVSMRSGEKTIEEMLIYLKNSVTEDLNFNQSLVIAAREALKDFLSDLKKRNSDSYNKKYFLVEKLIFEASTEISSNQEMYKLLRYCTEGFFLTFDSFCELIFLKKVDNDYLLKKIFINRGRNTTSRKHKFFLVQIDERFCLFTNYKINPEIFNKYDSSAKKKIGSQSPKKIRTSSKRIYAKSPEPGIKIAGATESGKTENLFGTGKIDFAKTEEKNQIHKRSSSNIKKDMSDFKDYYLKKKQNPSNNIWQTNTNESSPSKINQFNNTGTPILSKTGSLNVRGLQSPPENKVHRISYNKRMPIVEEQGYSESVKRANLAENKMGSGEKRQPRWTYNDPSTVRAMKVITQQRDQPGLNHGSYKKLGSHQTNNLSIKPDVILSKANTLNGEFPGIETVSSLDQIMKQMEMNNHKIERTRKQRISQNYATSAIKVKISKPYMDQETSIVKSINDKNGIYSRNASQSIKKVVSPKIQRNFVGNRNYSNNPQVANEGAPLGRRMAGIERRAATYRRVGRSHDIASRKVVGRESYRVSVNKQQKPSAQTNLIATKTYGGNPGPANYAYTGQGAVNGNGTFSYRFSNTAELGNKQPGAGGNGVVRDRFY